MGQDRNIKASAEAGQDLSSYQYRAVVRATDGQVDPAGAGVAIDGILQDKPDTAGDPCSLVVVGITWAEAGAAFNANANLTPDSVGRLVTAGSGDIICARAWGKAATAAGDYVEVNVIPNQMV